MISAAEIRWQPFTEPIDLFEGVDLDTGLAGIIVVLTRVVRMQREMLRVAIDSNIAVRRDLVAARRRNIALIEELRAIRKRAT